MESRTPGVPRVTAIVYRDIPEPGSITGVTFGLSLVAHEDWKLGRPAASHSGRLRRSGLASGGRRPGQCSRGKCPFCYGDVINFGEPVSEQSAMSAFFVFVPSILEREDFLDIDVGPYKINLAGMYPIYDDERAVFSEIGLEAFWKHPQFDMYDVNCKHVDPAE